MAPVHRHGEGDPGEDIHLDAHLDTVLVGGREARPVVLAGPDPRWPHVYEHHRRALAGLLGDRARRIDHVGSTAVPGLAAKTIVDIQLTVEEPEDDELVALLEAARYPLRVREPGHRMFRTPDGAVQVHVWRAGSDDERRHVLFRDWLRRDPDDRVRYEATKRALAARRWRDTNYYAEAKGPVIREIMARAERWAATSGWRLEEPR
ncbi:MAG TPA: GrpB family protein [Acidimicrobiales bacterium]|nr:GrpB family protein [Acidimicrobiales bacterium]